MFLFKTEKNPNGDAVFPPASSRGRLPPSLGSVWLQPKEAFLAPDGICVHVCTCARACVSLLAASQLVRPNELIANGNGGLKCN